MALAYSAADSGMGKLNSKVRPTARRGRASADPTHAWDVNGGMVGQRGVFAAASGRVAVRGKEHKRCRRTRPAG